MATPAPSGNDGWETVTDPNEAATAVAASLAPASGMSPDALRYAAEGVGLHGQELNKYVTARGKDAQKQRNAIYDAAVAIAKAHGIDSGGMVAQSAIFKADANSLKKSTDVADQVDSAEKTALDNFGVFRDQRKQVPGQTDYPTVNRVWNFMAGQAPSFFKGGEHVAAMNNAKETAATEYAKAITGTGNSNNALSDSARQHARDMIDGAQTEAQLAEVEKVLRADMHNRSFNLNGKVVRIGARMSAGPAPSTKVAAPATSNPIIVRGSADYANAPKGAIVVWNGKQYRKP